MNELELRTLLNRQKDNLDLGRMDAIVDHLLPMSDSQIHVGIGRLKESLATVLFGVFFGALGVDNFYLGNTKRGLRKLIPTLLSVVFNMIAFILMMFLIIQSTQSGIPATLMPVLYITIGLFAVGGVLSVIVLVYWLMDTINAIQLTKDHNTERLLKL